MTNWSLSTLLAELHSDIEQRLERARKSIGHSGTKGEASENIWLDLLSTYLPKRYRATTGHVVDSENGFSEQIDIIIFDRQYSPFIFKHENQKIIPAESVYAVFEAKQEINAKYVKYAMEKIASVRCLHRTSLPIPHAGGTYPARELIPIYGGLLALDSGWKSPMGNALMKAINTGKSKNRLDIGCVAAHGYFMWNKNTTTYKIQTGHKPATAFLFELISLLQSSATVPMIDIHAYAKWLNHA